MIIKKFVPCIYLYHEHAVRNLTDTTIVDTDPVRLADYYCEHNADELIVFDMSEGDAEHDAALDIIKEICTRAEVDVIGAGNVKRMEDIKKLLYAGCKKAVLDYEKESNIEITEEVSLKFGKDKILISYNDPSVLELHKEKIEKYISAMILMNPHQIRETQAILSLPFFVQINQVALNKLLEIFAYENVCGVTGNTINDNVKEIIALKDLCRENDIPIESFQAAYKWEDFKKNSDGMVPVIVQDYRTQEVLMMAYMNEEAYEQTLKLGKMTYYSRSRQELWLKGLTSGHYQYVPQTLIISGPHSRIFLCSCIRCTCDNKRTLIGKFLQSLKGRTAHIMSIYIVHFRMICRTLLIMKYNILRQLATETCRLIHIIPCSSHTKIH